MQKTVLIAEDEPFIVQSLQFLLERAGFSVDIATDGQQTLDQLESRLPDLLLLDLMMEYHTGFDVLKMMQNEPKLKPTKILVLSAKGQENDRRRALELGADRFITKPYANNDVVNSVCELLELKPE